MSLTWPARSKVVLMAAAAVLAATGTVAGVTAASAAAHSAAKTYTTDHQLCYTITKTGSGITVPAAGSITLTNQFGSFKPAFQADTPFYHCNPVEKILPSGKIIPITNPRAHLLCWVISGDVKVPPAVSVTNQFGQAHLTLGQASWLCLPTWKSLKAPPDMSARQPPGLSHYTCYPVRQVTSGGYSPPAGLQLKDEFGGPTTVKTTSTPNQLCVPTEKTIVTAAGKKVFKIVAGAKQLLCFPESPTPIKPLVYDQDQFTGPGTQVSIGRTYALCVPST